MKKYFRITVYNPTHNITAILDSNGYYNAIWQLSAFFVKNGGKSKPLPKTDNLKTEIFLVSQKTINISFFVPA